MTVDLYGRVLTLHLDAEKAFAVGDLSRSLDLCAEAATLIRAERQRRVLGLDAEGQRWFRKALTAAVARGKASCVSD